MTLPPADLDTLTSAGLRVSGRTIYRGEVPLATLHGGDVPSTTTVHAIKGAPIWLPFNKLGANAETRTAISRFVASTQCPNTTGDRT